MTSPACAAGPSAARFAARSWYSVSRILATAATGTAKNIPRKPKNSSPSNRARITETGCRSTSWPTTLGSSTLLSKKCMPVKPASNATVVSTERVAIKQTITSGMPPKMGPTTGMARVSPAMMPKVNA